MDMLSPSSDDVGAIVGGVVGGLIGAVLLVAVVLAVRHFRRHKASSAPVMSASATSPDMYGRGDFVSARDASASLRGSNYDALPPTGPSAKDAYGGDLPRSGRGAAPLPPTRHDNTLLPPPPKAHYVAMSAGSTWKSPPARENYVVLPTGSSGYCAAPAVHEVALPTGSSGYCAAPAVREVALLDPTKR
jgi:hypothetical protein